MGINEDSNEFGWPRGLGLLHALREANSLPRTAMAFSIIVPHPSESRYLQAALRAAADQPKGDFTSAGCLVRLFRTAENLLLSETWSTIVLRGHFAPLELECPW